MTLVRVLVGGRPYEVACDDGQEAHLRSLAASLNERVAALAGAGQSAGDAYILVLAGLMLTDELRDKTSELAHVRGDLHDSAHSFEANKQIELETAIAATLSDIAGRIETLAETLEKTG